MAATVACVPAVTGGTSCVPAPSTHARYEFRLAPLSLSTMTTLSGSHSTEGAAVAVSSLNSALAITVMVGGGLRWVLGAWPGTSSGLQAASLLRLLRHPAGRTRSLVRPRRENGRCATTVGRIFTGVFQ